jgi:hypothetical protein
MSPSLEWRRKFVSRLVNEIDRGNCQNCQQFGREEFDSSGLPSLSLITVGGPRKVLIFFTAPLDYPCPDSGALIAASKRKESK